MTESSTILQGAVTTKKANGRIKFFVGGLVIAGLVGYLIISSISSAGAYYREVGEVLAQQTALTGKNVRVSGNVVTSTIAYDAATLDLNFSISDPADPSKVLPIHFRGVQPDQLSREGASAIVEGSLGPKGVVEANNLLLKCPSRYDEQPGYEEIKVEAIQ